MGRSRLPRLLALWPLGIGGCLVTSELDELRGDGGACEAATADCDGLADNGCETDLETTAMHCGACGNACPSAPSAAPACVSGSCTIACDIIAANCDGDDLDGCETPVEKDKSNCGACGHVCGDTNASASTCDNGSCTIECMAGFASCDGLDETGCEGTLTTSAQCGICSRSCPATECAEGDCAGTTFLDSSTAIATAAKTIYVATSQTDCNGSECVTYRSLRAIPASGGAIQDLFVPASDIVDIAVDDTGVLYLATKTGLMRYAPGAATPGPTQLVAGVLLGGVSEVEVDSTHAYYWADGFGLSGGLFRVPREGGAEQSLVAQKGFVANPSPALALSNGELYFQMHEPQGLHSISVSGGTPVLVHPGLIRSITAAGGAVYFSMESDDSTILRHAAGEVTELITNQKRPEALASDGSRLWWWNRDAGALMRAGVDGTEVTSLFVQAAPGAALVAVDDDAVYWLAPASGQLNRLAQ